MHDDERIAELLDGRLGEAEAAALHAELSQSRGDGFRVFAEAAGVLAELEAEAAGSASAAPAEAARPGDVVPRVAPVPPSAGRSRGWRRPALWTALAAAAVLAVAIPLLRTSRGGVDDIGRPAARLAQGEAGLPAGWLTQRPWERSLSGSDPLSDAARAVRAGVLHTDFAVAVRAGDAETAGGIAVQLDTLLNPVAASGFALEPYRAAAEAARSGQAAQAPAGAALGQLLGEDAVRWGAWLEAARIATARRDAAFFHAREWDDVTPPVGADAEASRLLDRVRAVSAGPDWAALHRDLDALLRLTAS